MKVVNHWYNVKQQASKGRCRQHEGSAVAPGNDSFHVILSSLDALKGSQQPVPLSPRIAQPLLCSLYTHTHTHINWCQPSSKLQPKVWH